MGGAPDTSRAEEKCLYSFNGEIWWKEITGKIMSLMWEM
jgi:hypothetical protein